MSKICHFNLKYGPYVLCWQCWHISMQFWWFIFFSLFIFELNHNVNLSFLHCYQIDFVTVSCCFQALQILCRGTGPPSSRLLHFGGFFFMFNRPTQNQETRSTENEKKGPNAIITVGSLIIGRDSKGPEHKYNYP